MSEIFIRNVRIVDSKTNTDQMGDIHIKDGLIESVGNKLSPPSPGAEVIEEDGLICMPGLVDMHVHFRDPGQTAKEDLYTGAMAAAAGGVTSVAAMANTKPVVDNVDILSDIVRRAKDALIHVYQAAAVTKGFQGAALSDFGELKKAGAVAISDDGVPVENGRLMLEALSAAALLQMPVLSHSEDRCLAGEGIINQGEMSARLGVKGIPAAAEAVAVARDIVLSEISGCPLHLCHISTEVSVNLIRDAKARGVKITAETAPHYFSLTEKLLESRDADYRMNPPLRTEGDRRAVLAALREGVLDAVATDHAPHTRGDKADFLTAPSGVVGLQTLLPASYTYLVKAGHISMLRLCRLLSERPAEILKINAGSLSPGMPADLVLWDKDKSFKVEKSMLVSKSKNTPFKGMTLYGQVAYTFCGGKKVYRKYMNEHER